jgi:hypothetical protein
MIGVTERAKQELSKILTDNVDYASACFRLKVGNEGNLDLGVDIERPDDKTVEFEGTTLLVVEPELADSLENVAIDVKDSPEGCRLVIVYTHSN